MSETARDAPDTVAAIVLAAGHGSRYQGETHKLLAPFRGRPLVTWAVEAALAAGFDDVYVVTGAVDLADVLPDSVTIIENHSYADGQATSLRAALTLAEHDGHASIVVGLGDMPLVPGISVEDGCRRRGPAGHGDLPRKSDASGEDHSVTVESAAAVGRRGGAVADPPEA